MYVEVRTVAKKPNQSQTNVQKVRQQNAQSAGAQGQFGTEFASETNVQKVRQQNAQSGSGAQGQFGAEFASETDAQQVRQQNQQAEARKGKNAGQ
ncbi:gamma-type small acid-soluble spore protein [Siminovitchia acidinfaciens]|uniref:Small, acid-soluble spore protein gamma-type n=1 Tax=Siminovitchia acidinfaciens TaxID=2321395 RepID=A0A429XVV4_9BACI|nr:gamma-type small acid-soluble spore protein [Siminovitchia acidinfaciens]VEF48866.1 small, acid-soluble spore protein gamma-type [Bacillus freudenreichii]